MYRDDEVAARARLDMLERELEATQKKLDSLLVPKPLKRPSWWRWWWFKLTGRPHQPEALSWSEFPIAHPSAHGRLDSLTYTDPHLLSKRGW